MLGSPAIRRLPLHRWLNWARLHQREVTPGVTTVNDALQLLRLGPGHMPVKVTLLFMSMPARIKLKAGFMRVSHMRPVPGFSIRLHRMAEIQR